MIVPALAVLLAVQDGQPAPSPDEKALEEKARRAVAEFRRAIRRLTEDAEIIREIRELARIRHAVILKELTNLLLKHASKNVRTHAALELLAYRENPEAEKALLTALSAEASRARKDDQARDIDEEPAVEILKVLRQFPDSDKIRQAPLRLLRHANTALASEAIQMCADLRILESVDPLIALLAELDNPNIKPPNTEGRGDGQGEFVRRAGSPSAPAMTPEEAAQMAQFQRKSRLVPMCRVALERILGHPGKNASDFAAFWAKNKKRLMEEEKADRERRRNGAEEPVPQRPDLPPG